MKRIIDISEEKYNYFKELYSKENWLELAYQFGQELQELLLNSTPLNECEAEDCRSLKDIKEMVERKAEALDGQMLDAGGVCIGLYFAIANDLPSVYPKNDKPILDKIRAEIDEYKSTIDKAISEDELKIEGLKEAYTDCLKLIDKYKAESETQESENT